MKELDKGESKERGEARVVRPNRSQLTWDLVDPDAWLPTDHLARLVWAFVVGLDLARLYDKVKAREGEVGRPAADPAVQLALWLLATIEGIGSARELDRLTERHLAYRWLCCGVPVNYHGLADFRVTHADVLDELLTQSLASFMAEGFIDMEEIIVDGTKSLPPCRRGSKPRRARVHSSGRGSSMRRWRLRSCALKR